METQLSSSLFHSFRALTRCRNGVAATEFALLVPVLLLLFLGGVETSDALSQSRKVTLATNTLADLAAQETEILKSSVDDLFVGVEQIIETGDASIEIRLVSIIANPDDDDGDGMPDGNPVVHWSYDNSAGGGQPYAPGAPYTRLSNASLLDPNASIIVAEISYPYDSILAHNLLSTIHFDRIASRWPRRTLRVQLCSSPGNCTS